MQTKRAAPGELREGAVPGVVQEVLRSPGQPLDAEARAFFEPRFGSDFSGVRVHAGEQAAQSASSVNALAYTVGPHIVFGAGQYAPHSSGGRHLLAHELTHVNQSSQTAQDSGQTMFRLIAAWSRCPDGLNSAPDDVATDLGAVDARAAEMSQLVSDLVGARPPDADTLQAYEDRFGLPPAAGKGFLDRLTGTVKPTQEAATSAELSILSRRFAMVARLFREPLQYVCAGDAASVARANVPNCEAFAWSRRGVGQIVLCPPFWNDSANSDEQAAVLLHEAFHIVWGPSDPRKIGEVGDVIFRGSGGRFVNAHCYNEFAAQLMGTTSPAVRCPPPEP
jgi:hypothetical protein